MKNYRGYYLTENTTTADIDALIERNAVDAFKTACKIFNSHMTMEASINASEKAERLVKEFGYTWDAIEALECEVLNSVA